MAARSNRALGCIAVVLLIAIAAGVIALAWLRQQDQIPPLAFEQRCVATVGGESTAISREQAYHAAIIAGVSVRRDLDPHAATIALATAWQESGIRNLDYGDRDSVGLFQQRPSQDWGTHDQIMDPWYSVNAFYTALEQVPGWETGDITDTAQAVQKSGHPDAYRKHEANATVLATALTGQEPAAFSCFDERRNAGEPAVFLDQLQRTFGDVTVDRNGSEILVTAESRRQAWAIAAFAVAESGLQGIARVETDGRSWQPDQRSLPEWTTGGPEGWQQVRITFRA